MKQFYLFENQQEFDDATNTIVNSMIELVKKDLEHLI